jgi:hypothetical protein
MVDGCNPITVVRLRGRCPSLVMRIIEGKIYKLTKTKVPCLRR